MPPATTQAHLALHLLLGHVANVVLPKIKHRSPLRGDFMVAVLLSRERHTQSADPPGHYLEETRAEAVNLLTPAQSGSWCPQRAGRGGPGWGRTSVVPFSRLQGTFTLKIH